jgi:hypothetical protein
MDKAIEEKLDNYGRHLGPRVRKVRHRSRFGEFAGILLIETQLGSGQYVPLMRCRRT